MKKEKKILTVHLKRASLTVELAMIIPLILLTVFGIISLSFYMHHRSVLTCMSYETAISGAMAGLHQERDGFAAAAEKTEFFYERDFPMLEIENVRCRGAYSVICQCDFRSAGIFASFFGNGMVHGEYTLSQGARLFREQGGGR